MTEPKDYGSITISYRRPHDSRYADAVNVAANYDLKTSFGLDEAVKDALEGLKRGMVSDYIHRLEER